MRKEDIEFVNELVCMAKSDEEVSDAILTYLEKVRTEAHAIALGWMSAHACVLADEGKDIRYEEVPGFLEKFKKDLADNEVRQFDVEVTVREVHDPRPDENEDARLMGEAPRAAAGLHSTMDAEFWMREFFMLSPRTRNDPETVQGWFANAIMCGHDHASRKDAEDLARVTKRYEERLDAKERHIRELKAAVDRSHDAKAEGFNDAASAELAEKNIAGLQEQIAELHAELDDAHDAIKYHKGKYENRRDALTQAKHENRRLRSEVLDLKKRLRAYEKSI